MADFAGLLNNPMTHIGLGLLGQGPSRHPGRVGIGPGVQQGLLSYGAQQENMLEQQRLAADAAYRNAQMANMNKPPASVQEYLFAKQNGYHGTFEQWQTEAASGKSSYGLTPIWGQDKDGNPVMMQASSAGGVQPVKTPEGVEFRNKPIEINAGNGTVLLDPVTRNPIGFIPRELPPEQTPEVKAANAAASAQGTAIGGAAGEAIAMNPKRLAEIDTVIMDLEDFIADPNMKSIYGTVQGTTPNVMPGAVDAAARRDNLLAKLVLAERQKMKGQGTISDFESRQMEKAATILANPRISDKTAVSESKKLLMALKNRKQSLLTQRPAIKPGITSITDMGGVTTGIGNATEIDGFTITEEGN